MKNTTLEKEIYDSRAMTWQSFTKFAGWGCVIVIGFLLFLAFIWPRI